jgi:hypothetical protein
VLDHAREFVELVYRQAPRGILAPLASERVRPHFEHHLWQSVTFNHGKLYAQCRAAAQRAHD